MDTHLEVDIPGRAPHAVLLAAPAIVDDVAADTPAAGSDRAVGSGTAPVVAGAHALAVGQVMRDAVGQNNAAVAWATSFPAVGDTSLVAGQAMLPPDSDAVPEIDVVVPKTAEKGAHTPAHSSGCPPELPVAVLLSGCLPGALADKQAALVVQTWEGTQVPQTVVVERQDLLQRATVSVPVPEETAAVAARQMMETVQQAAVAPGQSAGQVSPAPDTWTNLSSAAALACPFALLPAFPRKAIDLQDQALAAGSAGEPQADLPRDSGRSDLQANSYSHHPRCQTALCWPPVRWASALGLAWELAQERLARELVRAPATPQLREATPGPALAEQKQELHRGMALAPPP